MRFLAHLRQWWKLRLRRRRVYIRHVDELAGEFTFERRTVRLSDYEPPSAENRGDRETWLRPRDRERYRYRDRW